MSVHIFTYLKTVLFAGVLMLLNTANIYAVTPACDTALAADTIFDSDMDCPSTAIRIDAGSSNAVLDCAGFSIRTTSDRAINGGSASGVTIKNCMISTAHRGGRGMQFGTLTNSTISGNTISTTGRESRGMDFRDNSSSNLIIDNTVHTTESSSLGIRFQVGSDNNTVTNNTFQADASYAVNIQSASGNVFTGNTLISPNGYLYQGPFNLQEGGMSVDSAGNIYAVENDWGSSAGGGNGIGEATAFFLVDPITGVANSVIPLLEGGVDVGFGFGALEILPNGRVMALADQSVATGPLYEINPNTGEVTEIVGGVVPGTVTGHPSGLDATSNTSLFVTTNEGELLSVDPDTGDVTEIGEQGIGWAGLAIHPISGDAYTISRWDVELSETAHLYKIDLADGQVIGSEIGDTDVKWLSDIDFAPDGMLYGNLNLVVIDITTGMSTTVGDGFGGDPLEPLSQNNSMENSVMQTDQGSINFTGNIILPSVAETEISSTSVDISSNKAMVDSTTLPFLNAPARITLSGLSGTERTLLVDENDDGTFDSCPTTLCTLVSFADGNLIFDVMGFTTYSSEETGSSGGEEEEESSGSGGSSFSPWLLLSLILGVWALRTRITIRYKM
jgi:hypothetical protein